jgi:putative intracellular protease/amidase
VFKTQINSNFVIINLIDITMSKKVLFVLTSHDELGNTGLKTGFWTEELAAPYYALSDKGVEITLVSPKGGQPPIDPKSEDPSSQTDATRRMDNDEVLKNKLKNTHKLSEVKSEDFDAVFYPGGHGPLWDLAEDKVSQDLIVDFYTNGKPVAFVCHAPGVLKDVKIDGEYLVKDKNVTGFTNTEEEAVQLTDVVPFLVEDMLKKNGGLYSKIEDWNPYAIVDGRLITGQNPASSEKVAEELLKLI